VEPRRLQSAAFLDRDGVINVDHGFLYKSQDFDWIAGAREAIRHLNDAGYLTVVVTNQSGIARGYYTESDFRVLHRWIDERLHDFGAHIDAVYFCPHLPDAPLEMYRTDCECRKPQPGMLFQAIHDLNIDPASSFLIGDKARDCTAATGAGVVCQLFTGSNLFDFVRGILATARPGSPVGLNEGRAAHQGGARSFTPYDEA
jgi:D-glycero-D-manno-heptose 1,7-bisphosphate phosphatase